MNNTTMQKTVLIVDDNLTDRTYLRKLLQAKDCNVIEACDGDAGYRAALEHMPQIILMDIGMPTTGFSATRLLKKNPITAGIPVVMVTSSSRKSDMDNCEDNGAIGYIVKPPSASAIDSVLQKIFA